MSPRDNGGTPLFDHMAKVNGQHVHCERAAFFATGGIPSAALDRIILGANIGFGMVCGGAAAVGVIAAASKVLGIVFS